MNRTPRTKAEVQELLTMHRERLIRREESAEGEGSCLPTARPSQTVTIPARLQKRLARRAEDLGISFGELVTHFLLKGLDGD